MEKIKIEKPKIESIATIGDIIKQRNPELLDLSCRDQEQLKDNIEEREKSIDEKELEQLLLEYGIEAEIREKEKGIYSMRVENHFFSERLPNGYGYKGGAARALLLRNLNIDNNATPRDIDIVRFTEEPKEGMDDDLARKYMPDDFSTGYGVEFIEEQDEYFKTRDFSINEVLASDKEILATRQCILDNIRKIIRLTEYEKESFGGAGPKMLSKSLRLYAEAIIRYGEADIKNIEDYEFERYFINPFWLALQMDRAYEQGQVIAEQYTEELKKHKQIPQDIKNTREAVEYLSDLLREDSFYYRHATTEQFELEYEWIGEEYESLPKFRGHGKSRGDK